MAFNSLQNSPSGRRAIRKLAAAAITTPNTITSLTGTILTIAASGARTTDVARVVTTAALSSLIVSCPRVSAAGIVSFTVANPCGADIVIGTSNSFVVVVERYDA